MSDRLPQPNVYSPCPRLRRAALLFLLLLLAAFLAGPAAAQEVSGYRLQVAETPLASVVGVPPGHRAGTLRPLVTFAPAVVGAQDRLEELIEYNATDGGAAQVGFVRGRADAVHAFDGHSVTKEAGTFRIERFETGVVFSARVRVEQAWAVRIRLDEVTLPHGTQIWVVSEGDGTRSKPLVLGPFGLELRDASGGLWLPAAPGPEVTLEVHVPRTVSRHPSKAAFVVSEVAELFDLEESWLREEIRRERRTADLVTPKGPIGGDFENCRIDATCIGTSDFDAIDNVREAVARISFMKDGLTYACTATLVADELYTGTPYLLTANHCFSTAASAASLTAYFDFRTDDCDGTEPNLFGLPQVSGSNLLVTAPENDMTLVQLSGLPSGDVHFMGWTPDRPVHDEVMHSVTHPGGRSQTWATSTYIAEGQPNICANAYSRALYHLSTRVQGATSFGSSGGAQILDRDGGLVVGQIRGACFKDSFDFCQGSTYANLTGSFEHNYSLVSPWLGDEPGQPLHDSIFADGFESGNLSAW